MKKILKRKEKGDIALIAIFATIVILTIVAFIVDFGLIYFQSARLQNAVDSTTVAVAHNLMAEDSTVKATVEKYMKDNGVDITEKGSGTITPGKLRTKITYGDNDAIVIIDKKGLKTEETDGTDDEDKYITAGYLKVTVAINCKGYWAAFSGLDNKQIAKSGYAKCDMQYNEMPEALKYTIFGNSTNQANDYDKMTVGINGRTNNAQAAANVFVNIINGLNEKLIQPLIGIFGGTPNYNTLVNASLSHAVINGDVHSNSDISIGVNNLQASRSKDRDFDGKDDECICQILCKKDSVNQYCTVCQGDYRKCDGDEQTDDDYNQVIFTAVNKIDFSAGKIANGSLIGSLIGSENDINTRVFVRNYQYVEQTQVALYIINKLNFDMITSTESLRNAYTQTAEKYFEKSITLTAPQKSAVLNQAKNLEYVSPNKYKLVNQKSIVYAATNAMANQVMTEVQGGKTLTNFLQPVTANGIDTTATPESLLLYDGTTIDKESSVITFTKPDSDSTAELSIVDSENTNRSIMDMTSKSGLTPQAEAGYRFALAKSFQQYSNHIEVPNMKPYFIRAINRSVKNATTSKSSDSTDLETSDATSVKDAVKKTQTKLEKTIKSKDSLATVENLDGTFKKGAADATNDYLKVDEGKADTYVDNSYMSTSTLTDVKTSPILKYRLSSTTNDKSKLIANNDNGKSPYTFKKYSAKSSEHTTYNGINVFDSDGELNSAENVIKDYSAKNSSKYGKNAVEKFNKSDVLVDSDHDDATVHDYENHYGDDAVEKKKHYIENTLMLSDQSEFSDSAPAENDVFLMSKGTKKEYLNGKIKSVKEASKELSNQELSVPADLRLDPVEPRYKTLIDATLADLGYDIKNSETVEAKNTAGITKDYTKADGTKVSEKYSYEDLLPGQDGVVKKKVSGETTVDGEDVKGILEETREDFEVTADEIGQKVDAKYNELYNSLKKSASTANGWNTSGGINRIGSDYSEGDNWEWYFKDKTIYNGNIENPWRPTAKFYGATLKSGYSVVINGNLYVNDSKGSARSRIGNNENDKPTYLYVSGNIDINRGDLNIGNNTTVICEGNLHVWSDKWLTIGENSTLIVGGDIEVEDGRMSVDKNSVVVSKSHIFFSEFESKSNTQIYCKGDFYKHDGSGPISLGGDLYSTGALYCRKGSGNINIADNSKVYLGRDLSTKDGNINIGKNAYVIANMPSEWENDAEQGVVNVGGVCTLTMDTGSVLVTHGDKYHRISAMRYDCASGSLIVTDMIKSQYDKNKEYTSKFGNVICKKMDVRTTEFNENAHVFVSDEIYVQDSKQITFNPGTKLLLGKNTKNESISNCGQINFNRSSTNRVFALGATGTVTGLQSGNGNYTLYDGSFLSAPGLSINNLTVEKGGGFCIPKDSSITANNLTINDGSSTYIGLLNIKDTLTINSNVKIEEIASANKIVVNESKRLLIEKNCTAKDITNKSELLVTKKLTVNGTFDNYGTVLLGLAPKESNPGTTGTLSGTGAVNNYNILQVYGSADSVTINNKYNTAKSRGSTTYISIDGNLNSVTNEKESVVICKGNFKADNVVNTGNIQLNNMTVKTSFTNNADATVKVDNYLTLNGSANNNGFVEVNGNSQIEAITNAADLKLNGTAEFTGKVTNTGKLQVTSYGATFNEVENSGEISVAGTIASKGTVTNSNFICSNNDGKFAELVNSGVVSVSFLSTGTSSAVVNKANGVIEVFGGNNSAVSNITTLDNSGDFVSNKEINVSGDMTNSGKFECFGKSTAGNLTNTGKVYSHGSLVVTATINNNSNGNSGADNSIIYVGNAASYSLEADRINNYANIFVDGGTLKVGSMLSCRENSALYVNKGDITTNHIEIFENCSFKYNGKLTINGYLVNRTNLSLKGITAERIQNYGTLYVESSKNFTIRYFINMPGANFALDGGGALEVINHRDNISIFNEGNMYVNGDVYGYGSIRTTAGEIYINGDADVANSVSYDASALCVENSAEVYIYGSLPVNAYGNGLFIKANADENAVKARVGIYGKKDSLFSSKIETGRINCEQKGANIFFGNDVKVTPDNNTQNLYGNMFVYGKYECSADANFNIDNSATLYINGDVNAPKTTIYLKNQSGFYCFGSEVILKAIISDFSRVYLMKLPSGTYSGIGSVQLSNVSLIYYPNSTTLANLTKSEDSVIMSDPGSVFPIYDSNFAAKNSTIVTIGNIKITSRLTIPEGSTLCVGGNIYFCGASASIVNNGNLYIMGKMYYSSNALATITYGNFEELSDRYDKAANNSFDDFVTLGGQNADLFVGKTKSGALKYKNSFNTYGNQKVYIDNDLVVTGNLGQKSYSKAGTKGSDLIPNRGESVILENSSTLCVSGDIYSNGLDNNTGNGVYVTKGSSISSGGSLYADSTIYNFGTTFIMGKLVNYKKSDGTEAENSRKWSTDREDLSKLYEGISLLNGSDNAKDARFFVGGVDKNGKISTETIIFEGYVHNYGKINIMQPTYIKGHSVTSTMWFRVVGENTNAVYATRAYYDGGWSYEVAPRGSLLAQESSVANFGSDVAMLGGYLCFNTSSDDKSKMPVFSSEGDATYGMCIINGGIFYAKGKVGYTGDVGHTLDNSKLNGYDVFSDYYIHHLELIYFSSANLKGDFKGSFSIVNGYVYNGSRNGNYCPENRNAVFYSGGGIQVGTSKNADANDVGGTVQNYGSMYVNGSLNVYSSDTYAINYIALSAQLNSKTVIAGDCYSSGGTVTMRNSLFMCDGDFISRRCSRLGISELVNSEDDLNSSSYLYIGGNMATSTNGTGGAGDIAGSWGGVSTWNYLDIFSNASVYVGGSFFTNSIFTPHMNVTLVVDGQDKGKVNTKTNFITWLQTIANNVTLSLNGYNPDDFTFIVNNRFDVQQTLREGRTISMLNRFYVHGSAFLNGRAKISDMTKFYVYGDFVNKTDLIGKITAFEIGRAIDVKNDGDTWASKGTFMDENDEPRTIRDKSGNYVQNPNYDYNYANACYLYVQGKLDLDRKVNIYPGTTVKTGKDYSPRGMVKLSHDSSVYSGGKISTHRYIDVGQYANLFARENINAWNYICVREHGILYSGGDVKCGTSFEAKTASTIYSCGSIKATLSNIKIRDRVKLFCSGNMTALSYIELGKYDEKYVDTLRKAEDPSSGNVCTCTGRCTKDDPDASCPICKDDYSKCKAPLECICSTPCTENSKTEDCPVCKSDGGDWHNCEATDPDNQTPQVCTCTTKCTSKNDSCDVCKYDYSKCAVNQEEQTLENDITKDYTDPADGGEFYIGKKLASYTSYIRQYGFSSTAVGQYVFAYKYLTLRSNSDIWVLPEAFNSETYRHVDKTFESDGTILGTIIAYIRQKAYDIKEKMSFKNGSVYTMGDLTLNKNASLMGTYDSYSFGQAILCHDSLMYFGHDIKFYGPSLDLSGIFSGSFTGFKAAGDVYTTMRCTNKAKHPNGYTMYTKSYDPSINYKCDKCGASLSKRTVKEGVTCPVTIYANNDIVLATSTDMSMCYAVACNGDVTISDPYASNTYDDRNLYQLPNAIASYNGNITYATMYGKIAALFYAPSPNSTTDKKVGNIKLDGYYQEIWGSCIGDTVSIDTFYINFHRFNNWRTMDLKIAESGNVYMISKEEYDKQVNNVDEEFMTSGNTQDETDGGAHLFFDRDILNKGSQTGNGAEQDIN